MLKKLLLTGCMLLMTTHAFAADNPHVVINTSFGEIELELEAEKAPITVNNFLDYVDAERYDGTDISPCNCKLYDSRRRLSIETCSKKPRKAAIKNEADNGLKIYVVPLPWRVLKLRLSHYAVF